MKLNYILILIVTVLLSTNIYSQTQGNVFLTYPNSTSSNESTVSLERITGNTLYGTYATTYNHAVGVVTTVNGPDYQFTPLPDPSWDPADNDQPCFSAPGVTCPYTYDTYIHFDEVNVYYHIDKFRNDYINTLGTVGLGRITAHVNVVNGQGGGFVAGTEAWYDLITNELYFGKGNGSATNNFARDYKIIYHEYFHAIHDYMNPNSVSSAANEIGAITEGLADYFAGAYTNTNTKMGEYAFDVQFPASPIRDMASPGITSYSSYDSQIPAPTAHEGGEFFSSILWDLRNTSGVVKSEIDELIFDAMDNMDSSPNFQEFMDEMIALDISSNSGKYFEEIHDVFNGVGITSVVYLAPSITSNTTISGTRIIYKTVSVENNSTLTINPGATIKLESNRHLTIRPGSRLLAQGTQASPITFERNDPASKWGDINLNSSSGNILDWVLVDGGNRNIDIASANNTLSHVTSRNGWRGISGFTNADGGGRASATLEYCLIENNTSVGIVAWILDLEISYTTVQGNAQSGIYLYQSEIYPFHHNFVGNNGGSTRDGIEITSSGALYMHNTGYGRGYNKIYNNGDDELSTSGTLVIGQTSPGSGGYNEIYDYWSGTNYLVDNNSGVTVKGYYTHFGAGTSPQPGMFDGSIDTYNYLSTDPTYGITIGHNGQAPTKQNPFLDPKVSEEEFFEAYSDVESNLKGIAKTENPRQSLNELFQISRVSDNVILRNRFKDYISLVADGNIQVFDGPEDNDIAKNYAQITYVKILMQDGDYEKAKIIFNTIESKELERYDNRDYLHLKLSLEIHDEDYTKAWNSLQMYYQFEESQGEDIDEIKAVNSPIELYILEKLNFNAPQVLIEEGIELEIDLTAYPNPFNPTTTISFTLNENSDVTLKVFDLLGREIAELLSERMEVGSHSVSFNASSLSSGIYIYQLRSGSRILTKKMTLVK